MATVTGFDLDSSSSGLNAARSYTEGQSAIPLAPNATVSATGNFNGQTLTISGLLAEDEIGFGSGVFIIGNTIRVAGSQSAPSRVARVARISSLLSTATRPRAGSRP
jgi:hypothetical protein